MTAELNEKFPIFLGSEIDQADPKQAMFHVLPVPYEKSVSYGGGTAKGPSTILNASWQLEKFGHLPLPASRLQRKFSTGD